jgi:CheY-like chemotaxis protein
VGTVADACAHLDRQGVVHGDLRPRNLRLIRNPVEPARFSIRLLGSEDAGARAEHRAALLPAGVLGPWSAYWAPEQWRAGQRVDGRADIYALGCLFFELLAGRPPFAGAGERELSHAHRHEQPPDLGALVTIEIKRLIGRMLAKAPEKRYQTMGEIVAALELILGRHRSRFGELLRAPEACPVRDTLEDDDDELLDLAPLTLAGASPAPGRFIGHALALLRPLGARVRDLVARGADTLVGQPAESPAIPPTVLVAEDDDDTRLSIVELLEDHGYRVIAARHGREAHDYLRTGQRAECMVMDLWMPEMDGWALAAEMKGGALPYIPTIVVTAAEPHLGYPSPMVIRKPFDALALLDLVRIMSAADRTLAPDARRPSH